MGLFSSETKISVASVALNLIEHPPDSVAQSVVAAIMKNEPIPDTILSDAANGIALNVKKAHSYSKDVYTLGLPEGEISTQVAAPESIVKTIIETELQQNVVVIYSFVGLLTAETAAMEYLRNTRGYIFSENKITLHDYYSQYPNRTLKLYNAEYIPTTKQIILTYRAAYSAYEGVTLYDTITETIAAPTGVYLYDTYCIAAYSLLDQNGQVIPGELYWYYRISTNSYPELKPTYSNFSSDTYLPVVPLRKDNVDLTAENKRDTELYITSKELLDILCIDIETVASIINENPSVGDIDHAYIMFGIEVQTKNEASLRYLFEYFDYLGDVSVYTQNDFHTTLSQDRTPFRNRQTIRTTTFKNETFKEYGLDVTIQYNYITSDLINGVIGPVGKVTSHTVIQHLPYGEFISDYWGSRDNSYLCLRLQIEPHVYKEVKVFGLIHINKIYDGHSVATSLVESQDIDNHNLIIPVHFGIASRLPLMIRNEMYYDSFRIILNSYQITKVKWYQTGIFKIALFALSIGIAIYTGQVWVSGLITAAQTGTIAVLSYILPAVLASIAITTITQFVAKQIGGDFALIIGSVIALTALTFAPQGSFSAFGFKLPTAQTLLSAGSALANAGSGEIQTELEEVTAEIDAFNEESERKWSALDEAKKLLDTSLEMDPMRMVDSLRPYQAIPNESPDAFYTRTIHAGNIGVLSLDVVENYVGLMLKLPEVKYA